MKKRFILLVALFMSVLFIGCTAAGTKAAISDQMSADEYMKALNNAVAYINKKTSGFKPDIAIVLGSGLGGFADVIANKQEISYSELAGFPVSTVAGHDGKFIFGTVNDVKVVCMKGRVHCYEGYDSSITVMPIRVMGLLGAKKIILTNAAGGIRDDLNTGDFMLITDHISSYIKSPLIGPNLDALGDRFVDMTTVYDNEMRDCAKRVAAENGIELKEGVYLQTYGPQFETPTEINNFEKNGADAVGMSTVCEAIAARHMGMKVCGISFISNKAAGRSSQEISDDEVQENAAKYSETFLKLVTALISEQR